MLCCRNRVDQAANDDLITAAVMKRYVADEDKINYDQYGSAYYSMLDESANNFRWLYDRSRHLLHSTGSESFVSVNSTFA